MSAVVPWIGSVSAVAGLGVITVTVFVIAREWRWNRDRSRRIATMRERERANKRPAYDWVDAMAWQLEEIRALPEVLEPRR